MNLIDKYKKMPLTLKVSFWCAFCTIFQKGISFLTTPIFTRILSKEEFGIYSMFSTWLSVMLIISTLHLSSGVYNKAMIKYKEDTNGFTSSMLGLGSLCTFICFIIYLLFKDFFNKIFSLPTEFIICIFAQCLVTPAISFWTIDNRFKNKYVAFTIVTILMSLLIPIVGVIMVLNFENKVFMKILSFTLIQCCFCGYIYISYVAKGKKIYKTEYWLYALKFNLPLIPHFLSQILLMHSDKIMVEYFCGESAVGVYSLCITIGSLLQILTASINASFMPWTYKKIKDGDFISIKKYTNILLILFVIPIIILILLAPEVILVVGTQEYLEAKMIIPPIVISNFLIFVCTLYSNIEFYYEKTNYIMVTSMFVALLNIVLNYIFISKFGYFAASITTLVSYMVHIILHCFCIRRIEKKHLIGKRIYNDKIIFSIIIFLIILMLFCLIVYNYFIIRMIAILITILLVIIFHRKIIIIFKNIFSK